MSVGRRLRHAHNIADLERLARRRLPRVIFDFMSGGAEDERTIAANRDAFERYAFRPRMLTGARPDLSVEILGAQLDMPVLIGPTGLNGIYWHGGDRLLAQAAANAGAGFVLSTASNSSLEDVAAAADGPRWFQLYPFGGADVSAGLVSRAKAAGYGALVLTVDSVIGGKRERDLRHRFAHEISFTPQVVLDGLSHPRWLASVWLRNGMPRFENVAAYLPAGATSRDLTDFTRSRRNPTFDWSDATRIRDLWNGPMLIKGILSPADAAKAASIGCDGIVISNHGGRQLDGTIGTLEALPGCVAAIGREKVVLIDGGFRRGTDIAKALALGAHGVLLGRATLFGFAAGGRAGASRALDILKDELQRTLALLGCSTVADLRAAAGNVIIDRHAPMSTTPAEAAMASVEFGDQRPARSRSGASTSA